MKALQNDWAQSASITIKVNRALSRLILDDGPVTDDDLTKLFEKLLLEDQNNMASFLTVDAGQSCNGDSSKIFYKGSE